jgi:hypothetical protein
MNQTVNGTEIAERIAAGLCAIVAVLLPTRRGALVQQRQDEIHLDGRADQEADVLIERDGRVTVRAVVRRTLPAGADAPAVAALLRDLGVL